ncbi:MAG: hypothetical protein JWM17_907 [Actinobacteria bacterium]|nr:hypothetical protein [Actinomycetota bacterium]
MGMRAKLAGAVMTAILASGMAGAGLALPASATEASTANAVAASGLGDCRSGNFCAWFDAAYQGHAFQWYGSDGYWENNTWNGVSINNRSSSWYNHGITGPGIPSTVRLYDGYYGTGAYLLCLHAGQAASYVSPGVNDHVSSHYWASSC